MKLNRRAFDHKTTVLRTAWHTGVIGHPKTNLTYKDSYKTCLQDKFREKKTTKVITKTHVKRAFQVGEHPSGFFV